VHVLKRYLYKYNVTKFLWAELTYFARALPAGCTCRDVPCHWNYLVDLLQHLIYSADLPSCGIGFCRWSPTIIGNSLDYTSFLSAQTSFRPFWGFPTIFKSCIFSVISLTHLNNALINRPDEKRYPRICLSLTPMISLRFSSMWD